MLALVACTVGVHKVDRANGVQWKREHINLFYACTRWAFSLKCTFNFCFCTMLGPSRISGRPRFIKIHGKRQRCQIYIGDQTLINSSEALEKSRRGEINIHGEREGCTIYGADQPLIGNYLAAKTLHQSHQGCDGEQNGGGSGCGRSSGNGGRYFCCCYCCCCCCCC